MAINTNSVKHNEHINRQFLERMDAVNSLRIHYGNIKVYLYKVIITKNYIDPNAFVIDSFTQGIIDSATLEIDGGYIESTEAFTFPGTFPLVFSGEAAQEVYTYYY